MLSKTRAIMLHYIRYNETSVIAYCYTKNFGRISLIIQGVRKKNAKVRLNLLQPLQINEIDFYFKEKPGLMRLKEIRSCHLADNVLFDTSKSTIALFLAEIMYKSLKEEVKNTEQYCFLEESIQKLNILEKNRAAYYLSFLVGYSMFLGFFPNTANMEHASYFDLKNGVFTNFQPIHEFYVKDENLEYFKSLLYEYQSAQTMIPALKRSVLLDIMLDYFMLHMDGFTEIKSVQVLKDVFH